MNVFLPNLLAVLSQASTLFLIAAGLNLVFGLLRVINVTQGSFYMYGAFLATTLIGVGSTEGSINLLWIIPAALIVAVLGSAEEMTIVRPLYKRDHLTQLLTTYGAFLILDDLAIKFWGTQQRSVTFSGLLGSTITVGRSGIPVAELIIIAAALAIGITFWWIVGRTHLGQKLRALAQDRELLSLMGVNVRRMYTAVFAASAGVAALTGGLAILTQSIGQGLDTSILVDAFLVAVIGGLGSTTGAALGALLIASVQQLAVGLAPSLESYALYAAMLCVLVVRPTGLLGRQRAV